MNDYIDLFTFIILVVVALLTFHQNWKIKQLTKRMNECKTKLLKELEDMEKEKIK